MTTQRKRGRPPLKRLPMGSAGAAPRFEPDDALWAELAQTVGHDLDDDARVALTGIVQRYFDHVDFGTSAPKINDALRHLEALDRLFAALVRGRRKSRQESGGLAALYAESGLDEHLQHVGHPPLRGLIEHAEAVASFTMSARAEIAAEDYPGFDRNGAWRSMIWALRQFAMERGWRPTVSASHIDLTGNGTWFVTFVALLQAAFPPEARRFDTSTGGLTKAIYETVEAGKKVPRSDDAVTVIRPEQANYGA